MNVQDYIHRQRQRRNIVVGLSVAFIAIVLALVLLLTWMLREPIDPSIPEPGAATVPPDGYPDL